MSGVNFIYDMEAYERQEAMREPYREDLSIVMEGIIGGSVMTEQPVIYEIGTGFGVLGKALPERYRAYSIGSDIDAAISRTAVEHYGSSVVANAEAIPFRDESLDLILGFDSLHWVLHQKQAFREIERTLKPNCAAMFLMGASGTIFFIEDEGKVLLPTVWPSGNVHVEEVSRYHYDAVVNELSSKLLDGTNELNPDILKFLQLAIGEPNLFNGLVLDKLKDHHNSLDEFEITILRFLNTAIRDGITSNFGVGSLSLFTSDQLMSRYRAFLATAALESGLSFETMPLTLGQRTDRPLDVDLFAFQKR